MQFLIRCLNIFSVSLGNPVFNPAQKKWVPELKKLAIYQKTKKLAIFCKKLATFPIWRITPYNVTLTPC